MQNTRRRLEVLERLPQFRSPPSLLEHIGSLALKQMSDEDLAVMINMMERDRGEGQTPLPCELAAVARHGAARETEARQLGFKSFADAERRAARRP
jgi:hypothetical protein